MSVNIFTPVDAADVYGEVPEMATLRNPQKALRTKNVLLIYLLSFLRKTKVGFVFMGIESTKYVSFIPRPN